MTKNVIAAVVGSVCAMFLWEAHSFAQGAVSGTSLNITGPASISGSTSLSSLSVSGTADFLSNTLFFGTSGSNSALSLSYDDAGNSSITFQSTRPSSVWNWQRLTASGTSSKIAMQLDASNRLILTGTADANPPQLVLDPNGAISLGGSNLLTQAAANSLYLSATAGLVASNGNIGIGVTSPDAKLQINLSSASTIGQIVKSATSQTAALQQWQDSAGNTLAEITSAGGLKFINGTTTVGSIDKNGSFRFTGGFPGSFMLGGDVNNFTLTPNVRKLARIVGPGYSDPNRAVTILGYDNGNGYADLWFGGVPNGSANAASTVHFATSNSNETVNGANIIDRLSVDNAGQVLINGFNASAVGLTVKGGTAQTGDLQRWQNSAGTVLGEITASGNFGIGTVAPANQLHVESQTNGQGIVINKNTLVEGDYSSLLFGTTNTPSAYLGAGIFLKRTGPGVGDFILANRGSAGIATPSDAVITINSAGNLGIGTTTPQAKMDVNGSANVSGTLAISGSGAIVLPDGTLLTGSNTLKSVLANGTISNLTLSGTTKIQGGLDVGSASVNGSSLLTQATADSRYVSSGYFRGGMAANQFTTGPAISLVGGSASGVCSFAGINATANGSYSTALGVESIAWGETSMVFGFQAAAYGHYSVALGPWSQTIGACSVANGFSSKSVGTHSIANGVLSTSNGADSTASGPYSTTNGVCSVASGPYSTTNGDYSVASGPYSIAGGKYSIAAGCNVTAAGYSQYVIGQYNISQGDPNNWVPTDELFTVGNGTDTAHRNNAFIVKKNGDTTVNGKLTVSGTSGGIVVTGSAVQIVSGTTSTTKIVASGSNQLVLIPEQGDLSMGDFTHGSQPPQQ